ncbi:MAG: AIR synthase-related protein, partial [Planctomycetota bacterium]
YDLAGFAVGVADRAKLITGQRIVAGDVVIGLESSGLHSNGFSLVRKVVDQSDLGWEDCPSALEGRSLADVCLHPTRLYSAALRAVQSQSWAPEALRGVAHITGGGIEENLDRILPPTVDAVIDGGSWPVPAIFNWLQSKGQIDTSEMRRVFNMGIGMALVVDAGQADSIVDCLRQSGYPSHSIGKLVPGSGHVRYVDG